MPWEYLVYAWFMLSAHHTHPVKIFPPLYRTFLLDSIQPKCVISTRTGKIVNTELLRVKYCHENPSRERNNDINFASFGIMAGIMHRTQSNEIMTSVWTGI